MDAGDWLTAVVGFVGVLVGGGITFFTERAFRADERRQLRAERINRVHRMTGVIFNELLVLNKQVLGHIPETYEGPTWRFMRTLIGVDATPIHYSPDDIGIIGGPKYDGIAADLAMLAAGRNNLTASLSYYNSLRPRLAEALAPYTTFEGNVATTSWEYKKNSTVVMLEMDTESLANLIAKHLLEMRQMIYRVTPAYNQMIAELYGPKNVASITLPDASFFITQTDQ